MTLLIFAKESTRVVPCFFSLEVSILYIAYDTTTHKVILNDTGLLALCNNYKNKSAFTNFTLNTNDNANTNGKLCIATYNCNIVFNNPNTNKCPTQLF